jgi:hypothetical protein
MDINDSDGEWQEEERGSQGDVPSAAAAIVQFSTAVRVPTAVCRNDRFEREPIKTRTRKSLPYEKKRSQRTFCAFRKEPQQLYEEPHVGQRIAVNHPPAWSKGVITKKWVANSTEGAFIYFSIAFDDGRLEAGRLSQRWRLLKKESEEQQKKQQTNTAQLDSASGSDGPGLHPRPREKVVTARQVVQPHNGTNSPESLSAKLREIQKRFGLGLDKPNTMMYYISLVERTIGLAVEPGASVMRRADNILVQLT